MTSITDERRASAIMSAAFDSLQLTISFCLPAQFRQGFPMRKFGTLLSLAFLVLLLHATYCFGQTYSITDLGTLGGAQSQAFGINDSGQVVGNSYLANDTTNPHAFRTAPNAPINPTTDDLGTLGGPYSFAYGINSSGQVVGMSSTSDYEQHAFRTAPNAPINSATDDLGTLGGTYSSAYGINSSGQVVGFSNTPTNIRHAFRTAPNAPINSSTDDLSTQTGVWSDGCSINESGQVVGSMSAGGSLHAFRTVASGWIDQATNDLGTLGGSYSNACGINDSGQVVGMSWISGNSTGHALRTGPNSAINPLTDDLFAGHPETWSAATAINAQGQVVGDFLIDPPANTIYHAFLYRNGTVYDLNDLIPEDSGWVLTNARGINAAGQIVGFGSYRSAGYRAFLLTPVIPFKATVLPPLHSDRSSIFKANRGAIPVKFSLTKNDAPTCALPAASISVSRTSDATPTIIGGDTYSTPADSGTNFRIDEANCQYVYNMAASSLGTGTYQVDISINGTKVGVAVFALK